jgi:CRISPR-associated protein Csb3
MSAPVESPILVNLQPANPGQFFACCGLLELANRLWNGAEGWFEGGSFLLRPTGTTTVSLLQDLLNAIASVPLHQVEPGDDLTSPIALPPPFDLRLDWWKEPRTGKDRTGLKVWASASMHCVRIARAMQAVLRKAELQDENLLNHGMIVYEPSAPQKKVEPYYFDARRGCSAHPLDIGFSLDPLGMKSAAYPAVEFLCLVGLQRFRPKTTTKARVFEYYPWHSPLPLAVASVAACGLLAPHRRQGFRFENAFRTDQKKHKAFTAGTPI